MVWFGTGNAWFCLARGECIVALVSLASTMVMVIRPVIWWAAAGLICYNRNKIKKIISFCLNIIHKKNSSHWQ
jgi:hypothetical protein